MSGKLRASILFLVYQVFSFQKKKPSEIIEKCQSLKFSA